MNWNPHRSHSNEYESNNYENIHIKREPNISPQPTPMDYQIDSQFTNLLTPSPQGNDTRMFFGDGVGMASNNNHLLRFNPLTPPGLPNAPLPILNGSYETQQNQHQNTPQRGSLPAIETPSITPPMDESLMKSPKSGDVEDKNGDSTSGEEKLDSDVNCSAIYQPQYNSHGKMRMHKCKRCDFVAKTKAEYWTHIRIHMNPAKILKCPHYTSGCRFVTELKHYLEYHIRLHKNEKPFRCEKCNYCCINKSMLNSHMKSHSGLYQYHCRDCDYATKYCHSLKKHLRKYEHEPGDVLDEDGNPDPSIIVDVNGRRRGPKGRKGRITKCLKTEIQPLVRSSSMRHHQQPAAQPETPPMRESRLAAMLMGQTPNIMNNFLPNTLSGMMQRNESLQYNVVLPYLQILANHQAALARLAPGQSHEISGNKVEESNESDDVSNAMDLSQTPKKMDNEGTIPEEDEEDGEEEDVDEVEDVNNTESQSSRGDTNTPTISSTSNTRRKGRTLNLEPGNAEETNSGSSSNNENEDKQNKLPLKVNHSEKSPTSETSSNSFNVESLIRTPTSGLDKSTTSQDVVKNCSKETNVSQTTGYYSCKHCDIYFKDVVLHSLHMGFHSCNDVFKCNICGEKCNTAIEFFVHLARKAHDDI